MSKNRTKIIDSNSNIHNLLNKYSIRVFIKTSMANNKYMEKMPGSGVKQRLLKLNNNLVYPHSNTIYLYMIAHPFL